MLAARPWNTLTLIAVLVASAAVAEAQPATATVARPALDRAGLDRTGLDAQLGRIFQASVYAVPSFGPARWLPDGAGYSTVEAAAGGSGGNDIVRYDAATGARSVLVPGARLLPPPNR